MFVELVVHTMMMDDEVGLHKMMMGSSVNENVMVVHSLMTGLSVELHKRMTGSSVVLRKMMMELQKLKKEFISLVKTQSGILFQLFNITKCDVNCESSAQSLLHLCIS